MVNIKPTTSWHKATKQLKDALAPLRRHPHRTAVIGLILLGLASRFWLFGQPNQAVFDEVYFGKFVSNYFTHQYFFDIHPPLGKLLIAGFAWIFRFNPNQSFASIGTAYTGHSYMLLRFLPGLASALLPVTFYGIARRLGLRLSTAVLIGLAICFDNALITQGRFILIDSFLLLFGFASLWAYLGWRKTPQAWWRLGLAAALAGMAMSVKWTGMTFVALPIIVESLRWQSWPRIVKALGAYLFIPLILYASFFMIHLALLNRAGEGDAFMTPAFQKTLGGSIYENDPSIAPLPLSQKIIELNLQMYSANASLTATHPYSSQWWQWPLMYKPISYWLDGSAQIWLIGNPIVWWGSTLGMLLSIWWIIKKHFKRHERKVAYLLWLGFLINFLPFVGITRVMFLYHYFIPLGFAILVTGLIVNRLSRQQQSWIILAIMAGFFIFAPYTYGLPPSLLSVMFRSILPIIP